MGFWNGSTTGAMSSSDDPPSEPAKELEDLLKSALESSSSATTDANAEERTSAARRLASLLTSQAQNLTRTSGREGGCGAGDVIPTLLGQRRYWIPLLLSWVQGTGGEGEALDFDLNGGGAGGGAGTGRRNGRNGGKGGNGARSEVQIESLRALTALVKWTSVSGQRISADASVPLSSPSCPPPSIHAPLPGATQRILIRHADSVPLLVSLLSSPDPAVHERAMWMLGSLAGSTMTGATAPTTDTMSLAREITDYMNSGDGKTAGNAPSPANKAGGQDHAGDAGINGGGGNADNAPPPSAAAARKDKNLSPRDVIFAACGIKPILACLDAHPDSLPLHRLGAWTLSNLIEGRYSGSNCGNDPSGTSSTLKTSKPCAADEIDIFLILPTLRRMLHYDDDEVLTSTCWTLSHLCDGPAYHISAVIYCAGGVRCLASALTPRNGLIPRLVELLLHPNPKVGKPALRAVGNVVCADCTNDHGGRFADRPHLPIVDFTEIILDCGAVPRLRRLIGSPSREIQKEACWTLSNIAAGTSSQIEAVLASGAVPPLAAIVNDPSTDKEVRSEACWVVLNATSCGNDSQIRRLIGEGCVGVLGVLLGESNMVMMALEGLERVLQSEEARAADDDARRAAAAASGGGHNGAADHPPGQRPTILQVGGLVRSVCESSHNSNAVMKRARRIWDGHFVSCALCQTTYSCPGRGWGGHYGAGGPAGGGLPPAAIPPPSTHFCTECKCHVCYRCDCRVYHLSYQEELWQHDEEQAEKSKTAKKSKKQRKKEKERAKKEKRRIEAEAADNNRASSAAAAQQQPAKSGAPPPAPGDGSGGSAADGGKDEPDEDESAVDLVSYLQQTGSIIALAKLLDSLYEHERLEDDNGGGHAAGGGGGGKARATQ